MVGVIPAAGRGTRAYPYTKGIPKCMLEVAGEPNLARVIRIMREDLGIRDIVVIIGQFGGIIREYFGDGSRFGVRLTYVENDAIEKGLSYSISLSRPYVTDYFCVMLGDECYVDSNHRELLATNYRDYLATCAVIATDAREQIAQNYAVHVNGRLVTRIVEKPSEPGEALLGLGTFILSPAVYDELAAALADAELPNDPVSVLGRLCEKGARIAPFYARGCYVNINDRDGLNLANNLVRCRGFESRTLALVLLMKGSAHDTRRTLDEFRSLGRFKQIVLVLPPGILLSPAVVAGVECVTAPSGRYGDMMRSGLDAADADILLTAQSDGSCAASDVPKFLEYLKDADFVIGTRTTRQLIHQGTNMRGIVRTAHVLLAKLLEAVWWQFEPRFTDVGSAYRGFWGSTYRLIRPQLVTRGPEYAVEMLVETLKCRKRIIEIPISYPVRRRGVKEPDQTLRTFVTIARVMLQRRFGRRTT